MIFEETEIPGVYIIQLEKIGDQRGFFARAWCQKEFEKQGLTSSFVQCNIAHNVEKNILRGMHFQSAPCQEVKLVRCTKGALFDVVIDLRPDSATYCKWVGVELTADNYKMLYVPKDFAHGYLTLTKDTEIFYQVSQFYCPDKEGGVRWNDPVFAIDWPLDGQSLIISHKDQAWPDFCPSNE